MEKLVISILLVFALQPTWGQDSQNYVKMTRHTTNDGSLDTYQYYDELGRLYEEVEVEITPRHSNLFKLIEYDGIGRKQSVWLPAVDNSMVLPKQQYPNQAVSTNVDGKPFSRTYYDGSPLNREVGIEESGVAWIGHRQSKDYLHNSLVFPLNCQDYYVTVSGELTCRGNYAADRLLVEKETDEDAHVTYVFRDVQDRIILQRSILGDNTSADTYYVYDYRGDLRYVLQPEYQHTQDLDLYAFQYTYDAHHQVVMKKLPGASPVEYAYDDARQLAFSRDGNQRASTRVTFMQYDRLGRLLVKGQCCSSDLPSADTVAWASRAVFGTVDGTGYALSIPLTEAKVDEAYYYDDYLFLQLPGFSEQAFQAGSVSAKGQRTGNRVRILGTDRYQYGLSGYDIKGREVRKESNNDLGGKDIVDTSYGYILPVTITRTHTAQNQSTVTEEYTYTYDHADRLLTTTHSLNGGTPVVLAACEYDELGRLKNIKPLNSDALKTQYTYNVRSWPKTVSSPLFTETLSYEDGTTPCWNGNISSMTWNADSLLRRYDYQYDGLSRLTQADYQETDGQNAGRFSTSYAYDLHGNMTGISRQGFINEMPHNNMMYYGTLDNLTLNYNGNQLTSVSNSRPLGLHYNFVNGANSNEEYSYDASGNISKDLNKGITTIAYNALNLPDSIIFNSGAKIHYLYGADGKKRQVQYYTPYASFVGPSITMGGSGGMAQANAIPVPITPVPKGTTKTFSYCGNLIYEGNTLTTLLFDGGYVSFTKTGSGANATYTPTYHFYMKDHLGSNRVVASAAGVAEQVNHYYPYGSTFYGETTTDHRFKYCGKELDNMHGLDWYDSSARYYDHVLGRFHQIDPLAEKYYAWSPYAYCMGNPMNSVDPDGRHTDVMFMKDNTYIVVGGQINDDLNIYVVNSERQRTGYVLGQSMTSYSFVRDNDDFAIGAKINMSDQSGQSFLSDFIENTPNLIYYMLNATGGGKYDFKQRGAIKNTPSYQSVEYNYRGMIVDVNGRESIASARDIGNYAAGYVAGINGFGWKESRLVFDGLESWQQRKWSKEGTPTQKAQFEGFRYGEQRFMEKSHVIVGVPYE